MPSHMNGPVNDALSVCEVVTEGVCDWVGVCDMVWLTVCEGVDVDVGVALPLGVTVPDGVRVALGVPVVLGVCEGVVVSVADCVPVWLGDGLQPSLNARSRTVP